MDDDSKLKVVTRTPDEAQAVAIASALEANGIRARVDGGIVAGFRAEAPALVGVLVAEEDWERAREILKEVENAPIDWDNVDVGRPEEE